MSTEHSSAHFSITDAVVPPNADNALKAPVVKHCESSQVFRSGHVSEPYSSTERTAALYILPFTDNLMSRRHHRCCRLENAALALPIRNIISSLIRPPGLI